MCPLAGSHGNDRLLLRVAICPSTARGLHLSRFVLSCVSLLSILFLFACTGASAPVTPTPTRSVESLLAEATSRALLPPIPTPTLSPPTPRPTSTPLPTLAPNLEEAIYAYIWLEIDNDPTGRITARIQVAFYEREGGLTVFIEGEEYCNLTEVFDEEVNHDLGCGFLMIPHTTVNNVSVHSALYDERYRCGRNMMSSDAYSVFACDLIE